MIWKKGLLLLPRFVIAILCTTAVLFGVVYVFATYMQEDQVGVRTILKNLLSHFWL